MCSKLKPQYFVSCICSFEKAKLETYKEAQMFLSSIVVVDVSCG